MKIDKDAQRGWRIPTNETPQRLAEALTWLGLRQGRTNQYQRLCAEFSKGVRSRENFFAYNEACGLLDIYYAWKSKLHLFPEIRRHIKEVFASGPLLSDDEGTGATNIPRSSAFVFLVAGKLLYAPQVQVLSVDTSQNQSFPDEPVDTADIAFRFNGMRINIECKRPLRSHNIDRRLKEALDQIHDPAKVTRYGIVGMDLSSIMRPQYGYVKGPSNEVVIKCLQKELQLHADRIAAQIIDQNLLGLLTYIRVPFLVPILSPILGLDGKPLKWQLRSSSMSQYLFVQNPRCSHGSLLSDLHDAFSTTKHDVPEQPLPLM